MLTAVTVFMLPYQNCAQPFEAQHVQETTSSSTFVGAQCLLSDGTVVADGDMISGFSMSSAMPPMTCGNRLSSRCDNGVLVPSSGFVNPTAATCTQYCSHPDSGQPVAAGSAQGTVTIPAYYTIASAATQAACTAALRPASTTTCNATTGVFSPSVLPQAQRFANCQVASAPVMCAYPAGGDYVQPTSLAVGARVSGLSANSALYPSLCSQLTVERTCLSTGQWNGAVPVYRSAVCVQQCLHPKTQMPVAAGGTYQYFTLQQGTQTQCANARRTTACHQASGVFLDTQTNAAISTPAAQQYASCSVIVAPTISSVTANPTTIVSGDAVTVSWTVTPNATQLILNNGSTDTDVTGRTQLVVNPTATAATNITYTLRAINPAGTVSSAVTVTVQPPPVVNPPTGSINSTRMFLTGHSLVDFLPNHLPNVVAASGSQIQYNHQFIPGSTLFARTRGSRGSTAWEGYRSGSNRGGGSGLNVVNEFLNPQTISGGRYDTLIVTERHDLIGPLQYEDTVRYLRHYHDRFIAGNPQGITYFYESWWNINKSNPAAWINYERSASPAWQCMATRINTTLAGINRADRLRSLPAGAALAELVARATQGTVTGVTGSSTLETLNRIFTDEVHPTALAAYYMSMVVYSAVYKKAPTVGTPPSGVSSATASVLQTIAWNFIQNYYATNTPLTLSQCQNYMRDSFCSTYWTFIGQSQNTNNCVNFLTRQTYDNPFYYNASQDAAYWY